MRNRVRPAGPVPATTVATFLPPTGTVRVALRVPAARGAKARTTEQDVCEASVLPEQPLETTGKSPLLAPDQVAAPTASAVVPVLRNQSGSSAGDRVPTGTCGQENDLAPVTTFGAADGSPSCNSPKMVALSLLV